MCWVKAGSGKSLNLLKVQQVDVIMVHAPAAEKQAVADGWAIKRTLIASNEFYIVGPENDPAGIAKAAIASGFIDFVASEQGQGIIRDYGKDLYGEAIYNDAEYASQYAH